MAIEQLQLFPLSTLSLIHHIAFNSTEQKYFTLENSTADLGVKYQKQM